MVPKTTTLQVWGDDEIQGGDGDDTLKAEMVMTLFMVVMEMTLLMEVAGIDFYGGDGDDTSKGIGT